MDKFELTDIKEFCLCYLNYDMKETFLNKQYVTISSRVFVWKILMCNKALNLIDIDSDNYIEELEKSTPYSMKLDRRIEIWNFILPIYKKLKEYILLNFKATDLYLRLSNNGYIKEEIYDILKNSGAHSWTAYISPVTDKFWIEADFTFDEFINRINDKGIPNEWWDFHQCRKPQICDE